MRALRWCAALAGGLALAALPFLRYAHLGAAGAPHADHAARHGGQLVMTGDHHVELVRRRGRVEAFVSDSRRRALQPSAGWVRFDGALGAPLRWQDRRLVADDVPGAREVEVSVVLRDGTQLAADFDLDSATPGSR